MSYQRAILPGCALLIVLAFITLTRADPDLWGHLRFGADIIDSGTIHVPETYSFTSDRPWVNHEWLAEVIMAAAYRGAGGMGLVLLKLTIIALSLACIWRIGVGDGATVRTAVFIMALALCGILPRVQHVRPQLFSVLCFSLLVLILRRSEKRHAVLWLTPPLMVFWANTHGGWIVGCATLGLWCAGATYVRLRSTHEARDLRSLVAPWIPCAVSIAATVVNPYGVELWQFLATTVGFSRRFISEWGMVTANVTTLGVWMLLAIVAVAALRHANLTERPGAAAITVIWGLAAFKVSRLDAFFALATTGLLAPELVRIINARHRHVVGAARSSLVSRAVTATLALATLVAAVPSLKNNLLCIDVHAESTFPESEAMIFVRERQLQGRMVTFFDWGQYAIWHKPDQLRVSMDGRRETVYSERSIDLHLDMYLALDKGLAYLDSLNADYVWVPRTLPLADSLSRSAAWTPAYRSDRSIIFARSALKPAIAPVSEGPEAQCRCFPGP